RPDGQPVGAVIVFLILSNRLEIGAKDEGRAVDEKNVIAGADRTRVLSHGGSLDNAERGGYRRGGGQPLKKVPSKPDHAPPRAASLLRINIGAQHRVHSRKVAFAARLEPFDNVAVDAQMN
ncbi:MAG: hypothetical protein JO107_13165, partial [Hyphomicrobiales bacterium]|nr:hypothetical protein [Hyphomicrobiales bacterium]